MIDWYYWLILGVLLIIIEIFTPGFVVASFGIGCIFASLGAYLGFNLPLQILLFCLGTMIVFFGIRPFYKKHILPDKDREPTNIDALKGQKALVTENIDPLKDIGRIKIGGEDWRAVIENNETIKAGEWVEVERIDGVKAIVKKSSDTKEDEN